MDNYTIISRSKKDGIIILENANTKELIKVDESKFGDMFTRVKDAFASMIVTARGVIAKVGNKIVSDFVCPLDIRRSHNDKVAIYFASKGASNDGSFDEYMSKSYDEEIQNLNLYMANVLVAGVEGLKRDAMKSMNESIATRRPKSWNSNSPSDNLWDAVGQVYGDLRDVEDVDDNGDQTGEVSVKNSDSDMYMIMRAAAEDYLRRSTNDKEATLGRSSEAGEEGEIDAYVGKVFSVLSTNGKMDNFGSAVNSIARFIKMRMSAPYACGADGLSGDDVTAFGWRMMYGIPGIGKSAMMGRIKEMAESGYFSKSGSTPYGYYSSANDKEVVFKDLALIPITCENADESTLQLPARDDGFSYRLVNPKTNKEYTDDEIEDAMRRVYGDDYESQKAKNGLRVLYDRSKGSEWNLQNATNYGIESHMTSKPTSSIPLIRRSEWSEEIDAMFPPTVVFLDEVYMAKPSGLFAIKSMVDKRSIGDYVIPSKVVFIGTSNRPEDFGANEKKAITSIQAGPTTERTTNIYFAPTFTEFVEYGTKINKKTNMPNVHPLVIDFLMMTENRFRFCNVFNLGTGGNGDRTRSVQRGWTQFGGELIEIVSQYERELASVKSTSERNVIVDSLLNDVKKAATSHLLYSDGEAFAEYTRGIYRGVPADFYKKMWSGSYEKKDMHDASGNVYSTDFSYTEVEKQQKGKTTVDVQIPHHTHISAQVFAEQAYKNYPFVGNGPSEADLTPDKDGRIPLVEKFANAYKVMYENGFVLGGDREYMQKLANIFADKFSGILTKMGLPTMFASNIKVKKGYMLGYFALPEIDDKMSKFVKPANYSAIVNDCGAKGLIDKNRVK